MKVTSALVGIAALALSAGALAHEHGDTGAETHENAASANDNGGIEIPLGKGRMADLNLSFEYRARYEYRRPTSMAPGATNDMSSSALLSRLRIGADLGFRNDMGLVLKLQDARSFGSEPRGLANTGNADLALYNAYWRFENIFDKGMDVHFGRQSFTLGSGRLFASPDWSNTGRAYDGARLVRHGEGYTANFGAFVINDGAFSHDDEFAFLGHLRREWNRGFNGEFMGIFELRQNPVAGVAAAKKFTWGVRANGGFGEEYDWGGPEMVNQFNYEVEFALQHGEETEQDRSVLASALALRFEYNLPLENGNALSLQAGYNFASGDSNPADNKNRTFRAPFQSTHEYNGHGDIIGWSNIHEYWAAMQYLPEDGSWSGYVAIHHFRRASTGDGLYGPGGVFLRPGASNMHREVGTEVDLEVRYNINENFWLDIGYVHFFRGNFIRHSASTLPSDGGSWQRDSNVFWASIGCRF